MHFPNKEVRGYICSAFLTSKFYEISMGGLRSRFPPIYSSEKGPNPLNQLGMEVRSLLTVTSRNWYYPPVNCVFQRPEAGFHQNIAYQRLAGPGSEVFSNTVAGAVPSLTKFTYTGAEAGAGLNEKYQVFTGAWHGAGPRWSPTVGL